MLEVPNLYNSNTIENLESGLNVAQNATPEIPLSPKGPGTSMNTL